MAERNHPLIRRRGDREAPGRCVGLSFDRVNAFASPQPAHFPRTNLHLLDTSQSLLPCLAAQVLASARVWPRTSRRGVAAW
ncbi:hypothetical protein CUR86_01665 [Salinicola acroporae]|uniref:Uncharacterized protein n=1 Tax=Salinicola acroporae TaxID=1541440 RepID=A0ABT6I1E0_9GAMM|nr:hypothetical protein [Salinicola acroporae]